MENIKKEIERILNLDCRTKEQKKELNTFLHSIKPIEKIVKKEEIHGNKLIPIDILENVFRGLSIKYGYRSQGIQTYYEDNTFIYYHVSLLKIKTTREWIGNVYGVTMWEVIAKMIVKIYGDIKAEQEAEHEKNN